MFQYETEYGYPRYGRRTMSPMYRSRMDRDFGDFRADNYRDFRSSYRDMSPFFDNSYRMPFRGRRFSPSFRRFADTDRCESRFRNTSTERFRNMSMGRGDGSQERYRRDVQESYMRNDPYDSDMMYWCDDDDWNMGMMERRARSMSRGRSAMRRSVAFDMSPSRMCEEREYRVRAQSVPPFSFDDDNMYQRRHYSMRRRSMSPMGGMNDRACYDMVETSGGMGHCQTNYVTDMMTRCNLDDQQREHMATETGREVCTPMGMSRMRSQMSMDNCYGNPMMSERFGTMWW